MRGQLYPTPELPTASFVALVLALGMNSLSIWVNFLLGCKASLFVPKAVNAVD